MSTTRYTVAPGRTVVLPREVASGPGATNLSFAGGELLELDERQARTRFIRNRIALGDLVATKDVAASSADRPTPRSRDIDPDPAITIAAPKEK